MPHPPEGVHPPAIVLPRESPRVAVQVFRARLVVCPLVGANAATSKMRLSEWAEAVHDDRPPTLRVHDTGVKESEGSIAFLVRWEPGR